MRIEDNEQAANAVRNAMHSLENRARSLYNYGYKDGFAAGVEETTRKLVNKIIEEANITTEGGENE